MPDTNNIHLVFFHWCIYRKRCFFLNHLKHDEVTPDCWHTMNKKKGEERDTFFSFNKMVRSSQGQYLYLYITVYLESSGSMIGLLPLSSGRNACASYSSFSLVACLQHIQLLGDGHHKMQAFSSFLYFLFRFHI